jgi:PAS domain S-box-containing protein
MADLGGTITYANRALCDLLEEDNPEDMIGKKFLPYYSQNIQKKLENEILPVIMGKGSWTGELEMISPGGRRIQTLENFFLIRGVNSDPLYVADIISDITAQKNAREELRNAYEQLKEKQEQVIQSAKMAAVGQLAGGVAHEVKNPLAVILHCAEYLDRAKDLDGAKLKKMVGMIKRSVTKADNIVRGLLDFSRPYKPDFSDQKINEIVRTSLVLVAKQLNLSDVNVEEDLAMDIPSISADHNRLEQVFINLIVNAVHAMPRGGTLTLRTRMKELTEVGKGVGRREKDRFRLGDRVVVVELGDTGEGIPGDTMGKIFTPFYSTKAPGKGTGLGLTITRTIVEQHNGVISMESVVGKGTKVTLLLPIRACA